MAKEEGHSAEKDAFAFSRLRPACVELLKEPCVRSVEGLKGALTSVPTLPAQLLEYTLLPLRMAIKRFGRSDPQLLEYSLDCACELVKRLALLDSMEVFNEWFFLTALLLDKRMCTAAGYGTSSEERVLCSLELLRCILVKATGSVWKQVAASLPPLGHCVSVLLGLLGERRGKLVWAAALETLLALSQLDSNFPSLWITGSQSVVDGCGHMAQESECRKAFVSFLPGIATGLSLFMNTEALAGQRVLMLALLCWARYVCLVFDDRVLPTEESCDKEGDDEAFRQTPKNLEQSKKNLSVLVANVGSLVGHEGWKVRKTLVLWSFSILKYCTKSLSTCLPNLLELLVTMKADSYPQVSESSQEALSVCSALLAKEESHQWLALLEERLHTLASALPRLLRQQDEARKTATLQLFVGFLEVMGPKITSLLHSHAHLCRIIQALLQTLEMDFSGLYLETLKNTQLEEKVESFDVTLHFRHFTSEKIRNLLFLTCQLLGFYGPCPLLVDHLLGVFGSSAHQRPECALLLTHVFVGMSGVGMVREEKLQGQTEGDQLLFLLEEVASVFTEPVHWDIRVKEDRRTVLLSCLMLGAIREGVRVVGVAVRDVLQTLLCPLMAKLGSQNLHISLSALRTLREVWLGCGLPSLSRMVSDNCDYLLSAVSLWLMDPSQMSVGLSVCRGVVQYGDASVLPPLRDCLCEVLLCLDLQQGPVEEVWSLLDSLSVALLRWTPQDSPLPPPSFPSPNPTPPSPSLQDGGGGEEESTSAAGKRHHCSLEEVRSFFLDYHRKKQKMADATDDCFLEEEEEEGSHRDPRQENTETSPSSPCHQTAVDIMQRCTHFLSSPSPSLRIVVLDALRCCLLALAPPQGCQDSLPQGCQDSLLPEVHKVWPAFLPRLSDPSSPVSLRALEVLGVMVRVCKGFLHRRIVKEVFPHLSCKLQTMARNSWRAERLYSHTSDCKLQKKLLECVGVLCVEMDVQGRHFEQLAHSCLPYLSTRQPPALQEACRGCVRALTTLDPDLMWLLLVQLCPLSPPPLHSLPHHSLHPPPHHSLHPLRQLNFRRASSNITGSVEDEYQRNTAALLPHTHTVYV